MDKKKLKKEYARMVHPMGVYLARNKTNGKVFIDSGLNLNGRMNRCRFQLGHGSHVNKLLQSEFNAVGADNFEFEVLDVLEPEDDPEADYAAELKVLEAMWIEKLQPFGEKGYHPPKQKEAGIS